VKLLVFAILFNVAFCVWHVYAGRAAGAAASAFFAGICTGVIWAGIALRNRARL